MSQENLSTEFAALKESLPPIIPAKELPRLLGGLFTKKTLANMRWMGTGPRAFKIGGKVFHTSEAIVEWFSESARPFNPDAGM